MKIVSSLALVATLATGLTLAPPAFAQKKGKEEKVTGPKLSPAFLKVAKTAQDSLASHDPAVAEPLVAQAEAAATTPDDKFFAAQFRYSVEIDKMNASRKANPNAEPDMTGVVRAMDTIIANPTLPAADRGKFYYQRAQLAAQAKQYPLATEYFTKAREAGYVDPNLSLNLVDAKMNGGDAVGALADLDRAIAEKTARGEKASEEWYRFGVAQANKRKLKPQTVEWLNKYLAAYPSPQTWYTVLTVYGFQQDSVAKLDNQQKIDVFRLMRASGGMADQYFYMDYALKAQNAGLPFEAQAVLKEGLANGKIPAANTEAKAMQAEVAQAVRNEGSLTALETKAKASATGSLAMQTADANLGAGNYAKAVELYRLAQTKGGVDADTVNLRLGIALARSGDKAGAAAAFAAVKTAPRAEIAQLWMTYINQAPAA